MDTVEVIVTAGGLALITFVLWFFFGKKKETAARTSAAGVQEVEVTVRGGYSPDFIEVEAGRPVRLTFVRQEENACTAELVFPALGVVKELPVGRPVTVDFTPEAQGEYVFHCGMNMVRGKVVATARVGAQAGTQKQPVAALPVLR